MIIAVNFPIQGIGKKKPEKIKASAGFEPVTSDSNPAEALIFSGFFFPIA